MHYLNRHVLFFLHRNKNYHWELIHRSYCIKLSATICLLSCLITLTISEAVSELHAEYRPRSDPRPVTLLYSVFNDLLQGF